MSKNGEWNWAFLSDHAWGGPLALGLLALSSSPHFFSLITPEESCKRSSFSKHQAGCCCSPLAPGCSTPDLVEGASLDCASTKARSHRCQEELLLRVSGIYTLHIVHICGYTHAGLILTNGKRVKRMTKMYRFWFMMKVEKNVYVGWVAKNTGKQSTSL